MDHVGSVGEAFALFERRVKLGVITDRDVVNNLFNLRERLLRTLRV